jgi:hypothetical protein
MVKWLLKLIVGSRNARVIRGIAPIVVKINEIEKDLQNLPRTDPPRGLRRGEKRRPPPLRHRPGMSATIP